MENPKQSPRQKRQVAYKTRVKDILEGEYVKEEGWTPNYVRLADGSRVSRANIIGAIVLKSNEQSHNTILIEDGSGKIPVRDFEKKDIFKGVEVGDVVLVIGRPREFGEKYIVPELIKKIDNPLWIDVRKLELRAPEPEAKQEEATKVEVVVDDSNQGEKIVSIIKDSDQGTGVDVEEIISKSGIPDAEKIVRNLLEEGEIFELKPGRIKVLE